MSLLQRAARTKRIRNTEAQKTKEKKARATQKKNEWKSGVAVSVFPQSEISLNAHTYQYTAEIHSNIRALTFSLFHFICVNFKK